MAEEKRNEDLKQETASAETEETAEAEESQETPEVEICEENDDLKDEIESLKAELDEKADLHLRLQAEFDNFRRRTLKEKEELRKTANSDLLSDLLPVLDNFDRALVHAESSPILEGIVMVQKQMLDILDRAGLAKVGEEGEMFDPNFHEAVMQEPADGVESGTILQVFQPGYKYQDKLLRAAMVKVAQ